MKGERIVFGRYDHAVDEKGRIFVPSKFRPKLGEAFYITIGTDRCLSVYTEDSWEKIVEKFNALPLSQSARMRFLFANAAKCEPDKQGRFLIPAELRSYAGIGADVTFIGMGNRAEIWDKQSYAKLEKEQLTPETLRQMMEELNF